MVNIENISLTPTHCSELAVRSEIRTVDLEFFLELVLLQHLDVFGCFWVFLEIWVQMEDFEDVVYFVFYDDQSGDGV